MKDLWYHHTLLRFVWRPVMAAVADEAHELANRLGDDHDLAMLLAWVREHTDAAGVLRASTGGARSCRRTRCARRAPLRRQADGVRAADLRRLWNAAPAIVRAP